MLAPCSTPTKALWFSTSGGVEGLLEGPAEVPLDEECNPPEFELSDCLTSTSVANMLFQSELLLPSSEDPVWVLLSLLYIQMNKGNSSDLRITDSGE